MKYRSMIVNAALFTAVFPGAASAVELPEGYVRLNYIESTYKQCIHTGYIPAWGDKIECDVKIANKHTGSFQALFGKQDDVNRNGYYFVIAMDATQGIGYGNVTYYERGGEWFRNACNYLQGYDGGYLVHVTMQTNVVEWVRHDGTKYGYVAASIDAASPTMNRELCIFGANHQDNKWVTNPTNMRLYSFKVTSQDGTVRCNFVPCRDDNGIVGLYDTVRGVFKSDESTVSVGPFKAGPVYGELPHGFRRTAYIQSTSAKQYIDTGYHHGTNDLVVMEYHAPKTWQINGYCYLFGSKADANDSAENFYFYIGGSDGQNYICYNHKSPKYEESPATYDYTGDPVHLECQAGTATWICGGKTGSLSTSATSASWTDGKYPLFIFSGNVAGVVGEHFVTVMRLYSFKIYRDIGGQMVLVHDFEPMMSAGGAAGLYDKVGDRFHGNARSGVEDFIAAPVRSSLPEGYTKVDYIRSTSAFQYIDTGYWHGTNDLAVLDYYAPKYWQINGYCYIFGSRMPSSGNHTHAVNWHFYIGGADNQNYVSYNHYVGKAVQNPTGYDYLSDPVHLECQASTATFTCGGSGGSLTTGGTFSNWTDGRWPVYIFTGDCGGVVDYAYSTVMRLYSFKLYRDIDGRMVIVRDFVPCVEEATGRAGLYDLVCERFHGNARAGGDDFVAKSFRGTVLSIR